MGYEPTEEIEIGEVLHIDTLDDCADSREQAHAHCDTDANFLFRF